MSPARPGVTRDEAGRGRTSDWTPVVLLVCSLSLLLAVLAWVLPRWLDGRQRSPGDGEAEHRAPAEVMLWVHRPAGGVKVALAPVWGDAGPDREHDLALARQLGLPADRVPAWYRLLLFNASTHAERVVLGELGLAVEGPGGRARWQSLAGVLSQAGLVLAPGQERVLRSLGALQDVVEVPAGSSLPLLLCFDRRVDLGQATAVVGSQEQAFRRRPIARGEFQRLLSDPDEELVRDL